MNWLGEFFSTLPDAAAALWEFGGGWGGLAVTVASAVMVAVFLLAAHRTRGTLGWTSATFGGLAALVVGVWLFGILPSAWVYFADGSRDLLADQLIPSQIAIGEFVIAGNFYQVVRDSVVMAETFIAMGACAVLALAVQKRYPRTLAEGEESRPQSGGYK